MNPPQDDAPERSPDEGADPGFADRPPHPSTDDAMEKGLEAYGQADEAGDPAAAYNVGVIFHSKGETEEAEEAFRRADERGHAIAPYALGELLEERGDEEGAKEAFRRAAERGYERARLRLSGSTGGADAQEKEEGG